MTSPDCPPGKESFLIHDISPQLERELMRRARESDRDTSAEASEIIEKHIAEEDGGLA
jgi:hypothetical protein